MPDPSPRKQDLDLEEGSGPWRLPSPQPTSTIATIYPINSSVHPRVAILDYRSTGWITHQVRVGPRGTTPGASLSGRLSYASATGAPWFRVGRIPRPTRNTFPSTATAPRCRRPPVRPSP